MISNLSKLLQKGYSQFYLGGMWRPAPDQSKSGIGSTLAYSDSFSKNLIRIIREYKIKNVFDCSCGDWFWMRHIKDKLPNYLGNDVCQEIVNDNKQYETQSIKFVCNDMLSEMKNRKDKEFDLIICRHTMEHLPIEYNLEAIQEMKRVSKFFIITSANLSYSLNENPDLNFSGNFVPPYKSVNLEKEPYATALGSPVEKFWDSPDAEKEIGTYGYLYSSL